MSNYSNYLPLAIRTALAAGNKIMEIYTNPNEDFEIEVKSDNSPLTKADKEANKIITTSLSTTPIHLLSEESENVPYNIRKRWKRFWLIDPLDGTKEFIKRNGEFTVNIALIENGVPVLGVIYAPAQKKLYYGLESMGAYTLTGIEYTPNLSIDEITNHATALPKSVGHQGVVVVASRSHLNEETRNYIDNLRKQGHPVTMINSGSSLKICLVTEGSADIYPRFGPTMEWDTAAGHAIARAAGCEVYEIDEKTPLRYNKKDLLNPWFIVKPTHIIR